MPDRDNDPSRPDDAPDLLAALQSDAADEAPPVPASGADAARSDSSADPGAESPPDLTIGGYLWQHGRPAAFEGVDGQPYTVDVDVEPTGDLDRPYAAFLIFLRWAGAGGAVLEHVESGDVAYGKTEAEAREAALELTLYEAKAELDAAIRRRYT